MKANKSKFCSHKDVSKKNQLGNVVKVERIVCVFFNTFLVFLCSAFRNFMKIMEGINKGVDTPDLTTRLKNRVSI